MQKDPELGKRVKDIITSRKGNPEHPDYPWGEIQNGGARTIYLDYIWGRNESHSDAEFEIIEAGKKWWKKRPATQKAFVENCIRTMRTK